MRPQYLVVVSVSARRRCVKDQVDLGKLVHGHEAVDAIGGNGNAHSLGTGKPV